MTGGVRPVEHEPTAASPLWGLVVILGEIASRVERQEREPPPPADEHPEPEGA